MEKCLYDIINTLVDMYTLGGTFNISHWEFMFEFPNRKQPSSTIKRRKENGKMFSFISMAHLYAYVKRNGPIAIHIGQYFYDKTQFVREREDAYLLRPRMLMFDIDGSDFDPRACGCIKKDVCNACWMTRIVPAVRRVLAVCNALGFHKVLPFFSGRRGVHIYITDKSAWYLTPQQRVQIVQRVVSDGTTMLDKDVTVKYKHMGKVPLLAHASTGNVCLPIPPDQLDVFLPIGGATHRSRVTEEQYQAWIAVVREFLL